MQLVNNCISLQLHEQEQLFEGEVTKASFLGFLRRGHLLTLNLVGRFPDEFIGLHASWNGGMKLEPDDSGSLVGSIFDDDARMRFPAVLADPDRDTRVFFTEGGCRYGRDSWWSGRFERRVGRIVFIVDSKETGA